MSDFSIINQTASDIKTIKIQGATNIAREAIKILGQEIQRQTFVDTKDLILFFKQASDILRNARATEPMMFNGLRLCKSIIQKNKKSDLPTLQSLLSKGCFDYVALIENEEKIRPNIGAEIISGGENIVTHCHSGSVVKILTTAWNQGKAIHIYNTETRPLYQGRRTSNDLVNAGVPDTMITDDTAPFFIDNKYESHVHIDKVIIGCDAIRTNGDIINKVGSFSIALSAYHSKIPLYIVGSLTKVDVEKTVQIELRDGKELWAEAPQGLEIINYAFDLVPAKFITGIITEHGIIKPKDIKNAIKTYCPRMLFPFVV